MESFREIRSPRKDIYSDRFIPSRTASYLETGFSLLDDSVVVPAPDGNREERLGAYSQLLKSELLALDSGPLTPSAEGKQEEMRTPGPNQSPNLFKFKQPRTPYRPHEPSPFSLSPVGSGAAAPRIATSPRKASRRIPRVPFKVLDAPNLQDDFYLNLVDWSAKNVLAVGLGSCVYLWSACTSKVTRLCDLYPDGDSVTSVGWTQRGTHLAVGTNSGEVQIWDTVKGTKLRVMGGHEARVGALAWNSHVLSSGSRDRFIYQRDVRVPESYFMKLEGHKQEVCGLKWSSDDQQLASGGNDNKLYIWSLHAPTPVLRFSEHTAAVKAISWSPHTHGLLASGGGTADRCIRFWNTVGSNTANVNCIDTGSQVCNLVWSTSLNELVSTHGYSQNQIIVWRYPAMSKVVTLTAHLLRVLYLAISPDGQTIVTGAGDETLRFWNVFPGAKTSRGTSLLESTLLSPSCVHIR